MVYNMNGKNIRIPDADLEKNMRILNITRSEAIQMWLEDEGYEVNTTVEELTEKAKANRIKHGARAATPHKASKPRERKPDLEKEKIITILAETLKNSGFSVEIVNKSKLIEFNIGENHYKLDLIKRRPVKNN